MANNLWPWDQRIQLVSATLEGFFSPPQLHYLVLYQRRSITVLCQKYQAILETFNKCMLKFWSWFLRLIPLASSAIHSFCVRRKISLNKETERTCCGCSTVSDAKQMDGVSLVCLAPRAQNSVQGIKGVKNEQWIWYWEVGKATLFVSCFFHSQSAAFTLSQSLTKYYP